MFIAPKGILGAKRNNILYCHLNTINLMKLLLAPNILLRGWDLLPFAYVDTNTGDSYFVTKEDMKFLIKCNGLHDFISDKRIDYFLNRGIIIESDRSIAKEQMYIKYPTRYIRQAHWAITNKCNFKCKHCFISAPHFNDNDITFESCCKIVDELYSCGIYKLSITGGEPLIRADFILLLKYIKSTGIVVSDINTNGSIISDNFISEIKFLNINPAFHVSYDGRTTHNWLRGVSNAEELSLRGIKLLLGNGFNVSLSYCLYSDNIKNLIENLNFIQDLGIKNVKLGLINHIGEWSNIHVKKSLSVQSILDEIISIIPTIITNKYSINIDFAGFIKIGTKCSFYTIPMAKDYMDKRMLNKWICCETLRNTLYINPIGKLIGCEMLTESTITSSFPNILEMPLKNIIINNTPYMNFIDMRLEELQSTNQSCTKCEYFSICHGGCRGSANINGNYFGKDPIACCYFRNGYYQKIKELMDSFNIPLT